MRTVTIGGVPAVALLAAAALAGCSQGGMAPQSGSSAGAAAPVGSAYERSGGPVTGSAAETVTPGATTGAAGTGGRMGNRTDVDNTPAAVPGTRSPAR